MKTIIIATILSVGVFLRPQMAPVAHDTRVQDNAATTVTVNTIHTNGQALLTSEMETLQGAGILECGSYFDADGDLHQMCCLNLWLFKLCGDVNISAAERFISSLL